MTNERLKELLQKKPELTSDEVDELQARSYELWDFITSQMREDKNELGNLVEIELKLEAESNQ